MYTPGEILQYIYENNLEFNFLTSLAYCKEQFTISEIGDAKLSYRRETCRLRSEMYQLNLVIEDEEIVTAVINELCVSAFLSRYQDRGNVHFLVHRYPSAMRGQFEEEIAREVVRYMILYTVRALRLDTPAKVDAYLGR